MGSLFLLIITFINKILLNIYDGKENIGNMNTGECLLRFMTTLAVSNWNITSIKLIHLLFLHANTGNVNRTVLAEWRVLFMHEAILFGSDCVSFLAALFRNTSTLLHL